MHCLLLMPLRPRKLESIKDELDKVRVVSHPKGLADRLKLLVLTKDSADRIQDCIVKLDGELTLFQVSRRSSFWPGST